MLKKLTLLPIVTLGMLFISGSDGGATCADAGASCMKASRASGGAKACQRFQQLRAPRSIANPKTNGYEDCIAGWKNNTPGLGCTKAQKTCMKYGSNEQ